MNDMYVAIKPAYYLSKLLIMTNYNPIIKNGKITYCIENNVFRKYFGIIIQLIVTIILSHFIIQNFISNLNKADIAMKYFFVFQIIFITYFMVIISVSYFFTNNKYAFILNKIQQNDDEMKVLGMFTNNRAIRKNSIGIIFEKIIFSILLFCVTILNVLKAGYIEENLILTYIFNTVSALYSLCHFLHFYIFIMIVSERFKLLKDLMKVYLTENKYLNRDNDLIIMLQKSSGVYRKLCEIVKDVNSLFSIQLLVHIAKIFFLILLHMYTTFVTTSHKFRDLFKFSVSRSIYFLVANGIDFAILLLICVQLKRYVSNNFSSARSNIVK